MCVAFFRKIKSEIDGKIVSKSMKNNQHYSMYYTFIYSEKERLTSYDHRNGDSMELNFQIFQFSVIFQYSVTILFCIENPIVESLFYIVPLFYGIYLDRCAFFICSVCVLLSFSLFVI